MERIVYYQPPPLCFAKQNIGEVSRSDGGVEKTRLCLFILLNSEKNEPRSSGSYRAIRLVATVAVGVCGTRSAQTVLALFPPSPLRLRRPIKAESGIVTVAVFFNPSVLRTPPLYFAAQNTEEEGEMYFPFASAPILYVIPCNVTGHSRGGVLRHSFIM